MMTKNSNIKQFLKVKKKVCLLLNEKDGVQFKYVSGFEQFQLEQIINVHLFSVYL